MIILRDQPLANGDPYESASCKWSSEWTGLLQKIIRIDQPDHPDGPASCKWSSGYTGPLQMIILMDQPLANDHPDGTTSCKWSSGTTGLLQMIIWIDQSIANDRQDRMISCKWSSGWILLLISIFFSFSVHLFLHRPRTQNSRIIGQYTHNLLGLKTLSFSVLLFIHKNMD